jgi:hypothetical protein
MAQPVINIGSKLDGKGFKQAETASQKLGKSVKKLGLTFAAAFSAQKLAQYGKNAVKAFAENEKSARRLEIVVKNLGLAFELPGIEASLDKVSAKFGYEGEVLREAFQKLITTTGSAKKSQDLLNLSLDIAAGSGVALLTVNQDLAAAYVGQTRGLRKYNLGLTQSELKTLDFDTAVSKLSANFKGAGTAELETYSGKMRVLQEASDNAQEIIGGRLVDSLALLAGEGNSIQPLADSMQDLGTYTGDAIFGLAKLIEKMKGIPGLGGFMKGYREYLRYSGLVGVVDLLAAEGAAARPGMGGYPSSALGPGYVDPNDAARKRAEALALKRARELAALQKKTLDTQKKQNALTKASKTLDLDRIGITAALKGQISETDRISLNLQLALLDKNESQALKLSAELTEATKRQNDLKAALLTTPEAPNPYRNWIPPVFNVPTGGMGSTMAGDYLGLGAIGAGGTANTIMNVQVILDGEVVGGAVTNAQVNQSLSGTFSDVSRYNGRGAPSIK